MGFWTNFIKIPANIKGIHFIKSDKKRKRRRRKKRKMKRRKMIES